MKTLPQVKEELKNYNGEPIVIMEVCGTHTSSIFKHGIRSLLSPRIKLISGPGCPVCVTPAAYIDKLIEYSMRENCQVLSFGDMMKVRGTGMSLTGAKASGGNVQVLYSPLQALKLATEHPEMQYVFAAVGFETTAPIYALMIEEMVGKGIENLKLLTSLKTTLPALSYICENEKGIDGFLCPGHVSVITGSSVYEELAEKYHKPFVVSGFEGEHILAAVDDIVNQILNHQYLARNYYTNAVSREGNRKASEMVMKYLEVADDYWRGIGLIENSAIVLRKEYQTFDAGSELVRQELTEEQVPVGCRCRDVILGRINPVECPLFEKACTPFHAVGPCMVSTEGACGIWYKNKEV